jgi:prepilin-type N-terminal cleavage/methylation domain-containing protein
MDFGISAKKLRSTGFSLIELMLVVLIICILTILSVGRMNSGSRDKVKLGCQKNLQTMYLSLTIYANDNKGQFPLLTNATSSEQPLSLLVPRCTTLTEMFICPGSGDRALPEGESFAKRRISYAYYMGRTTNEGADEVMLTDGQIDSSAKRMGQQIFSPDGKKPGANHGKFGGNFVLFSGETLSTPSIADRDFPIATNVTLLNPR